VEWVPEAYYVDNANTQKTRSYALLGLRAGYDFAFQGLNGSVFLDARNITDERYIASASVATVATPTTPLYEPGSGASAYAGLTLSW
jgi:iron complex outermembrane receptor protein